MTHYYSLVSSHGQRLKQNKTEQQLRTEVCEHVVVKLFITIFLPNYLDNRDVLIRLSGDLTTLRSKMSLNTFLAFLFNSFYSSRFLCK